MEGKNREKHFDQNRGEIAKFPTFYAALKKKTGFDNNLLLLYINKTMFR